MADYIRAHQFSANNRRLLAQRTQCGCFYCQRIFHPREITQWLREGTGTALCPYCGIDSVIGEGPELHITPGLLRNMHQHWFG